MCITIYVTHLLLESALNITCVTRFLFVSVFVFVPPLMYICVRTYLSFESLEIFFCKF